MTLEQFHFPWWEEEEEEDECIPFANDVIENCEQKKVEKPDTDRSA